MTTLQREVALKVRANGFTSEYEEEHGDLIIRKDDVNICRLMADDCYTYHDSDHKTEADNEMFYKAEQIIVQTKEYLSAYEAAQPFDIDGIRDYRKLAEFNGVVLGAKDMGEHGFQFSSWFKTYDGKGAIYGDYSFDYNYSKQSFAERSGLVNKSRQFTDTELGDVYRCLAFSSAMNATLTYEQEKAIESLMNKIECALPEIKDNPEFTFNPDEDSGMLMQ